MNKLLLLAFLGLVLGGGVWKSQNPDGTVDDLKMHANVQIDRLKSGVDAVIGYADTQAEEMTLAERVAGMEQQLLETDEDERTADLQNMLDLKLAEHENSLSSLQDALTERVAPMEDMTKAVAELDAALQDTRARTDSSNVRLDTIDRRLELLVRRLDEQTTETDLQALTQLMDGVQGSVDNFQDEFDNRRVVVTESLAAINDQISSLDTRLNTFVSSAANSVASDNSEDSAATDTEDAESTAGADNASVLALSAGFDERFGSIEERLATVNSDSRRIASLTQLLEASMSKITELEQQNTQAVQTIEELSDKVDSLATAGESMSIETIQAQVRDQLALAQSQIDSSADTDNTAELEALIETTRNRIQNLEQRVQGLPAASAEADGALETQTVLQEQIANLELRLGTIRGADPALESTVNDVKQRVEQLSAQGFVTQDELRAKGEPESIEYKIYFDRNSAEITEDAATVLNSFIAQEKNRTTGVSIFGFTDRSGSAAYNQQLALQRATNVRSYLIQNGLNFTKIKTLSGLGEDAAAAVLPDESFDAQQRVVVLYAAQP
ncbi:MAG: OmpA family protein [Granulosicoccus sp.]